MKAYILLVQYKLHPLCQQSRRARLAINFSTDWECSLTCHGLKPVRVSGDATTAKATSCPFSGLFSSGCRPRFLPLLQLVCVTTTEAIVDCSSNPLD
jgi:hypothetical protein